MYTKKILGLEESQAAIAAMIDEFRKNPENPPAAFAVVDEVGHLLAYARTDGSRPIISPQRHQEGVHRRPSRHDH